MTQVLAKYQGIADDLRRRVDAGEFEAEQPLPTESELQQHYQVSRNTIREAVRLLVQGRVLETRMGQGTFITEAIVPFVTTLSTDPHGGGEGAAYPPLVREQGREAGASAPEVRMLKCPPEIAAMLQISADDRVICRHQERFIDSTIWSRQTSYYPMNWVRQGAERLLDPEDIEEGAVRLLEATIGLKQVGYRDQISARLADEAEQALFGLSRHHTVIDVYRTSFTEDGTPIRLTATVFPSDRNQVVYNVGTVPAPKEAPA